MTRIGVGRHTTCVLHEERVGRAGVRDEIDAALVVVVEPDTRAPVPRIVAARRLNRRLPSAATLRLAPVSARPA